MVLVAACASGRPDPVLALDLPPLRPQGSPEFVADAAVSLDGEGHTTLSVTVTVPHSELSWVRTPHGFAAGAEMTVVFAPQKPGRDYGDAWEKRVMVSTFARTRSPVAALLEHRRFAVPAGKYDLRISVRDLNSDVTSSVQDHVDVPDYSRVPVGFADLEIGRSDTAGVFTPVAARRFGLDVDRLAARVVLFDRRPGPWPRAYPFHYRILDDAGEELIVGTRDLALARSADPVILRPDSSDLFLGTYTFAVEVAQGKSKWRVERGFEVEESGPPRGREFERLLEPLALIAEPGEIEHLKSLAPEDRTRGWNEFWRRRDPTPDTPRNETMLEFFRRMRYVEQHYHTFGPGWRSDMGRVYIKFGPPDQIENRPASSQSLQLEIWYYNRPSRRFVFADRDGFGRYVLVSPLLD